MAAYPRPTAVVGVDTGGTFTDFVFMDAAARITVDKRPSSPADPSRPVLDGLSFLASGARRIVHGTTVATNALLEGKIAPAALITTAGFEDVLEIGRQNRPALYDIHPKKIPPLVPRELRFGVHERVLHDGTIRTPLESREVTEILERLREHEIASLAVCLLHSYVNPLHEEIVGRMARSSGFTVSLSSEILPEFREYERTATTVVNACLRPVMEQYIDGLQRGITGTRLSIMQSSGGVIPAAIAARRPVHTVLSGPAGGVIAAARTAAAIGIERLITFDMGGTSTDVCLYDREPALTSHKVLAGHPIRVPMMDIHTVGAGGGSIAFVDSGAALKVGPVSAGADPGPVCYGRGNSLTVTDANLFLGRIDPTFFLGGRMDIYPERIPERIEDLARSLDLDPVETAEGIIAVANSVMERALRVISVEKGHDPREFTLFSFGGAGGLHAAELAAALGIPRVVVPRDAGVFSAYGMALADVVRDLSRTILREASALPRPSLDEILDEMIGTGTRELVEEGVDREKIQAFAALDMRYEGQSYEITVPLTDAPIAAFHDAHAGLYGYSRKDSPVEIVTVRARLVVASEYPQPKPERARSTPAAAAPARQTLLSYGGERIRMPVFDRLALAPGHLLDGPALVGESSSTTFLPPGTGAEVDGFGNLIITAAREQ